MKIPFEKTLSKALILTMLAGSVPAISKNVSAQEVMDNIPIKAKIRPSEDNFKDFNTLYRVLSNEHCARIGGRLRDMNVEKALEKSDFYTLNLTENTVLFPYMDSDGAPQRESVPISCSDDIGPLIGSLLEQQKDELFKELSEGKKETKAKADSCNFAAIYLTPFVEGKIDSKNIVYPKNSFFDLPEAGDYGVQGIFQCQSATDINLIADYSGNGEGNDLSFPPKNLITHIDKDGTITYKGFVGNEAVLEKEFGVKVGPEETEDIEIADLDIAESIGPEAKSYPTVVSAKIPSVEDVGLMERAYTSFNVLGNEIGLVVENFGDENRFGVILSENSLEKENDELFFCKYCTYLEEDYDNPATTSVYHPSMLGILHENPVITPVYGEVPDVYPNALTGQIPEGHMALMYHLQDGKYSLEKDGDIVYDTCGAEEEVYTEAAFLPLKQEQEGQEQKQTKLGYSLIEMVKDNPIVGIKKQVGIGPWKFYVGAGILAAGVAGLITYLATRGDGDGGRVIGEDVRNNEPQDI